MLDDEPLTEDEQELPKRLAVLARSEAEESIHKHNAYAERTASLGELRER